jgi:hypothetical protein
MADRKKALKHLLERLVELTGLSKEEIYDALEYLVWKAVESDHPDREEIRDMIGTYLKEMEEKAAKHKS